MGDSVLNLCIGDYIYNNEIDIGGNEKSALLFASNHKKVTMKLELGTYLRLERRRSQPRPNTTLHIAGTFEALIVAVYLDLFNTVKEFIYRNMESIIEGALTGTVFNDYKTELQECLQRQKCENQIRGGKTVGSDHQNLQCFRVYQQRQVRIGNRHHEKRGRAERSERSAVERY